MRIGIFSDLHSEFWWADRNGSRKRIAHPEPSQIEKVFQQVGSCDVLIAAGDIGVGSDGLTMLNDLILDRFHKLKILYVPGNHEYYGLEMGEANRDLAARAEYFGIDILHPGVVEIDNIIFIGATLWTDYLIYGDQKSGMEKALQMSDHKVIKFRGKAFSPADALELHKQDLEFLNMQLQNNFGRKVIVVTHHGPHRLGVAPQFEGNSLTPAFTSDLSSLIDKYHPLVWIFGHTHARIEAWSGSTKLVCSPWGYPDEPGCQPSIKIVTV